MMAVNQMANISINRVYSTFAGVDCQVKLTHFFI